jgi:hypothetical protein
MYTVYNKFKLVLAFRIRLVLDLFILIRILKELWQFAVQSASQSKFKSANNTPLLNYEKFVIETPGGHVF